MIRFDRYTSIANVPTAVWNKFVKKDAVGLETGHLRAIEESGINNIHPYYLIGFNNQEAVGIVYCFSIQVNLAGMAKTYPQHVLEIVKTWKPEFMNVKVVEVGHLASLGSTIEFEQAYEQDFISSFSEELDIIAKLEDADICIIRDISACEYEQFDSLKKSGFLPVMGFPVARMKLNWNSFEEYLASLKSKKRNNFLQKKEKLMVPEIKVEVIENYAIHADRLAELWKNVALNNNGYEHERLTPEYFKAMNSYMKGRSNVLAILQNEKIIAFGLNLIGDNEYFGVAEGMDYSVRDQYDLYANNIFESLHVACQLQKKVFNIGITAYEFKTSIGAELEPCIYFIKAFKEPAYTPVYADFIQKNITQPENLHRVFHNEKLAERIQLKEHLNKIQNKQNTVDPFAKHYSFIRADAARSIDMYPYYPVFESAQEPIVKYKNRDIIMLGTNSYLGLATHPQVKNAAKEAIDKYGSGCSGSPLLNGTLDIHEELTQKLAHFIGKQDALVFSTGYQTNVGVISALVNRNDVLIMDERNHASLIDGARLSGATVVRYKHNNTKSLEEILEAYADRPKFVVSDTIFSMEGTIIDLPRIVQLTKQYGARLMLDESHAIGVIGPTGRGVAEKFGLTNEVDIIMGTFSKSLASIGGFVAGDRKLIDTLKHIARSHIFSASLPPSSVAAVLASLEIIDEEPERLTRLITNARFMAKGLQSLGFQINYSDSAIISLFCGHELLALSAFHKLFEFGLFVNPVTSPAVPKNQEMIRISLMATHTEDILSHALDIFEKLRTPLWPTNSDKSSFLFNIHPENSYFKAFHHYTT